MVSTTVNSYLKELMEGGHDWTTHAFKVALFLDASLDQDTTAYSTTNEISGTGYTAGGATLTVATNPTVGTNGAYFDLTDVTWSGASLTANQGLIYNSTNSDTACFVLDFGINRTVSGAPFVLTWPTANMNNAIGRLVRGVS
jgi:hypothetical protein